MSTCAPAAANDSIGIELLARRRFVWWTAAYGSSMIVHLVLCLTLGLLVIAVPIRTVVPPITSSPDPEDLPRPIVERLKQKIETTFNPHGGPPARGPVDPSDVSSSLAAAMRAACSLATLRRGAPGPDGRAPGVHCSCLRARWAPPRRRAPRRR